jgi:hypothetical protein
MRVSKVEPLDSSSGGVADPGNHMYDQSYKLIPEGELSSSACSRTNEALDRAMLIGSRLILPGGLTCD